MINAPFLWSLTLALFSVGAPLLAAISPSPPQHETTTTQDSLGKFLREYVTQRGGDKETRYLSASADLNEDGVPEVVVYLTGPSWCGSGVCTALILASSKGSYKVITKLTIARRPIRMLKTKTGNWHDLGVPVQGGGIQPGREAILRFNGKTYPSNPSTAPRLAKSFEGPVLIHEKVEATPLF